MSPTPCSDKLPDMSNDHLLEAACEAARQAGSILKGGFGSAITAASKQGRHNLVTEFDHRSEQSIIEVLRAHTPDARFLAEESGHHDGSNELLWVIDPLDGTVNFAHGIPIFCVSIAAVMNGHIICGVIHQPLSNETFTCITDVGAWCNDRPMKVSTIADLSDSILVTGFPYDVDQNPGRCIDQFAAIVGKGLPVRRLGSAALDLAYVADGRFDGFWEVALQPWDMAAGVAMVRQAGGAVTHYGGRDFVLNTDSIIATNGLIQAELTRALEDLP
ncbi:MAG: inositol monophosphatase [Candidatus Kapabacteria bacterium]|nr:inositol monophosphatase [Candidatus Kapabacteria bacterium]